MMNNGLDPNVKIKVEPGTSEPAVPMPALITNIKTEPGLPPAPTAPRLTSFRLPRDLTLGGGIKLERPKKVYTPNLNVQRNKFKEESNEPNKKGNARNRGRNTAERGKNRTKANANSKLIQSTGVFSDGVANSTNSTRRYSGIRDRESSSEQTDRANFSLKYDRVASSSIDTDKLFNDYDLSDSEFSKNDDDDFKPIVLQNSADTKSVKSDVLNDCKKPKVPLTVPHVIESKSTYILIQFPDCLPGLRPDDKQNDPRSRRNEDKVPENNEKPESNFYTCNDMKDGQLGKLQILRSGKARLVLGDNSLIVDVGSTVTFRQDLIAAKISDDKQTGSLVHLGPVGSTLICSPDWESMLMKL